MTSNLCCFCWKNTWNQEEN